MSFIDLMGNTVWSEQDIINRTESMIRSEFSVQAETILNRKMIGEMTGTYKMSDKEKQELEFCRSVILNAQIAGEEARHDNELLKSVLEIEEACVILNKPYVDPILDENGNVTNQDEIDLDNLEKQKCLELINSMTDEQKTLFNSRNPPEEVEISLEPTTIIPEASITESQDVIINRTNV